MALPADLVARAADIVRDVILPAAGIVDREAAWPEAGIRALQRAGFGGLVVPSDVGGRGQGLLAVAQLCEQLGRACPSTAICFGMHLVGSAVLSAKATTAQRARYLEAIVAGEHLTTLALSEPGTGSHFYIPTARIDLRGDGYALSGTKSFVTNGGHADSYVMSVASAEASPGEFSCVIVPGTTPGLRWGAPWSGWGMRGNSALQLTLDGAVVGRDALVGEAGDEIWYVFNVITPYFLMAMSGTYLGIAGAALEHAIAHLRGRAYSHSGATLADSVVLQHRVGTLWAQLYRTRAIVDAAARAADAGGPEALPALCAAKAEVAETAERLTAEVLTLLGGRAYGGDHPVQRMYRDVRAAHVMAPTTDVLRTWTGRILLGLPVLGEQ